MNKSDNIFELGRGVKLIQEGYWHQYVLSFDFRNVLKPFVVSAFGKTEELYRKHLSIDELQSKEWKETIELSKCSEIIRAFKKQPDKVISLFNELQQSVNLLNGNWTSKNKIEVLNYNSNFSNWIDASSIPGEFHFKLDAKDSYSKNCSVKIPVEYLSGGPGYYAIYHGKFELTFSKILIWQNASYPAQIPYQLTDKTITLELFDKKIEFKKT